MRCMCDVTLRCFRANNIAGGNVGNFTYSECGFLALAIQHAISMRHIAMCSLPRCTIFTHLISYMAQFSVKIVIEYKICFHFLYEFCVKYFYSKGTERDVINIVWSCLCKLRAVLVLV